LQGQDAIIELLNEVLTAELTAINQYFVHAKMQQDWGYDHLAAHTREESIDEMRHAEKVVERILFLDGTPNLQRLSPLRVGEHEAIPRLNRGVALAVEAGDNGTRELLATILVDEEEHADWLETQLESIRQVGEANYLAQQLRS
jgi:bacterioferritin